MPLNHKKIKKAFKENVSELVDTYKEKGKIGTSKPKSKQGALKQALAISYAIKDKKKK